MWWTTVHQSYIDKLTPEQVSLIRENESVLVCVRTLQNFLGIHDTKLALHIVRGIKESVGISNLQRKFEEETASLDRKALNIKSI